MSNGNEPAYLECNKCPWNIEGIHDELSHYESDGWLKQSEVK